MDDADVAADYQLRLNQAALDGHRCKAGRAPIIDGRRRCLGCGGEIPRARLEAFPDAVRCIACQAAAEKTGSR